MQHTEVIDSNEHAGCSDKGLHDFLESVFANASTHAVAGI